MAHDRPFRFAAQVGRASSRAEWADKARKAEGLGYSCITMPDHFGDQLAPVPAMMAVADATTSLRIGSLVFGNDYKHPVVLAKEAATLDVLSGGRLELGLGAGWMRSDYEQSGIPYDSPSTRIERFEEGLAIVKGLMGDEPFSHAGRHYSITAHQGTPKPLQRPHPPILVGGGGRRVLSVAARQADIVGINANLKAGEVGPDAAADVVAEATRQKVAWVREAAGDRFDQLELNVLVLFGMVTEDRDGVAQAMAGGFGLSAEAALEVPQALVGTVDQIVEDLQRRREEYGFSYVVFGGDTVEAMAPVVARLAGT
jgi:probable F420-dependent oxidoreductase